MRARKVLTSPLVYVAWAILVSAALAITRPIDPYVFGFTALGLAWATGAVGLLAIAGVILTTGALRRLTILLSVGVAIAAVANALAILSTYKWA